MDENTPLICENNLDTNKTIIYTYDDSSNVAIKKMDGTIYMKKIKLTILASLIIFFLLSISCYVSAIFYEIDVYDFAYIYRYLNPARIFLLSGIILIIGLVFLKGQKCKNIKMETVFVVFVSFLYLAFGSAYYLSENGNEAIFENSYGSEANFGYEYKKKYLPYHDEYKSAEGKMGDFEIYKGKSWGTVMVYVDSYILNSDLQMHYEAEYLDTNNVLIKYKFLYQKLYSDENLKVKDATKTTYEINDLKVDTYTNRSYYIVSIYENGKMFYVTLSNAPNNNIESEDFAERCAEQFELMKKTVEEDKLLTFSE